MWVVRVFKGIISGGVVAVQVQGVLGLHRGSKFYMKTGECKFGEKCRFHHPIDRSAPTRNQTLEQNVKFTLAGLPRREGVEHCPFYMKTGTCSYGANCKFDHPPPGEVMAVAGQETSTKAEEEETEDGENVATAE
uniref:C3H1-type domain-containing protein n=1 Tax=Chenopodium quinoa TaxID=63459 RepID=A0A803N5K8_CHEQI